MSEEFKRRIKRQREDDPPLELLPRLFDRMKRGVWFRVLPTEDTFDDICDAMNQDWEDLLPLLIDHGLLACDIRDDVKNYMFKINTWELFQTTHRETLDMRRTPVRRDGAPRVWYICLGNPDYNNPLHQEKAIKQKEFAYQEFDSSSPKDKLLARELRAKAKEILLSNATARINKAKESKEKDKARDKVLQQASDPSKFEEAIAYSLALDLEREPRLDRAGVNEIEIHKRNQVNEQERVMILFTAKLWGWQDPSLTKRERMRISMAACRQVAYDYGHCKTPGYTMLPKWEAEVNASIATGIKQDPLSPHHSASTSYCDKIETKHPHYLHELYRYAVNAVNDAWNTRLSEKAFMNVYERLQNVLVMIEDDKGGNAKVEENRGKHFRKLEMPDASDESDNED